MSSGHFVLRVFEDREIHSPSIQWTDPSVDLSLDHGVKDSEDPPKGGRVETRVSQELRVVALCPVKPLLE